MRISGAGAVLAPAETVWAALRDRDVLLAAFPCIDGLDVTGNGRCAFTVTLPIAAVSGTYAGTAELTHADPPGELVAKVSAAGARGSVDARVTVRLSPRSSGGTEVSYEADAEVAGPVAGIGQRLLASIATRLAAEFIAGLDRAPVQSVEPAGSVEQPVGRGGQPESAVRTVLVSAAAGSAVGMLAGVLLSRRSQSKPPGRR